MNTRLLQLLRIAMAVCVVLSLSLAVFATDGGDTATDSTTSTDTSVTADTTAPVIADIKVVGEAKFGTSIQIEATVTDDVGLASVTLNYFHNGTDYAHPMENTVGDTYMVLIPAAEVTMDVLEFTIYAADASNNQASSGVVPITIEKEPAPAEITVTSVTPGKVTVSSAATTQITVIGTGFTQEMVVTVGGMAAIVSYVSETEISLTLPILAAGPAELVIATEAQTYTSPIGITYEADPVIPAPTGKLSGTASVRAGKSFTVDYKLSGTNVTSIVGTLSYDSSVLTLVSTSSTWNVTNSGNTYTIASDRPLDVDDGVIRFTFQVKEDAISTKLSIGFNNVTAVASSKSFTLANASMSVNITRQLSSNCNLSDLTVANGSLSPNFDPSLTRYNMEVPFEVENLEITAITDDEAASVEISDTALKANRTNTITVTVTAEDGTTKRQYVILCKRARDPNEDPGGNNYLANIVVEEFRLSPIFDKEITNYLIWLPYEVEEVTITGIAEDDNATITISGGSELVAGADNEVLITVTSESGKQRVYTIIVKRAPAHEDMSKPSTDPTESTDTTSPSQSTAAGASSGEYTRPTNGTVADDSGSTQKDKLLIVLYCILGVLSVAGIAVCVLLALASRKEGKFSQAPAAEELDLDEEFELRQEDISMDPEN